MPNGYELPKPPDFEDTAAPRSLTPVGRSFIAIIVVVCVGAFLGLMGQMASHDHLDPREQAEREAQRVRNRMAKYAQAGNMNGALEQADLLARTHPLEGNVYRGMILGELERYPEAIDAYSKVLEVIPDDSMVLNNRAYLRALAQIDLDEAMVDVEKAIAIRGDTADFIDTRGYLYYLRGEQDKALADLNQAVEMLKNSQGFDARNPGIGEIVYHRALIFDALSRHTDAKTDYQLARRLGFKIPASAPMPLVLKPVPPQAPAALKKAPEQPQGVEGEIEPPQGEIDERKPLIEPVEAKEPAPAVPAKG